MAEFIVKDLDNPEGEEFEDFVEAIHVFTKSVFWGNPATLTYKGEENNG